MKKIILFVLLWPVLALAQAPRNNLVTTTYMPGGSLGAMLYFNVNGFPVNLPPNTSTTRECLTETGTGTLGQAPVWVDCSTFSTGTVSSFSSGSLTGLFTTSVANPTTTPALSFSSANFTNHFVWGNNTGSTAPGQQIQLSAADLTNGTTGTAGSGVVLAVSPTISSPSITGQLVTNLGLGVIGLTRQITNEGVSGTVAKKVVKVTGIFTGIAAGTSDTGGFLGICVSNCGTAGAADVAVGGDVICTFDGATTANHYVQNSPTSAAECHDAGATLPTSGQVLGKVKSTNGGGGDYHIDAWPPEIMGFTAGAGTVTSFSAGTLSPLFTTSVANATTTPALSFSLSTACAHCFLGNSSGSTAAPGYTVLGSGDVPCAALPASTGDVTRSAGSCAETVTAIESATTSVNVSSATAPTAGQVLQATSSTAAIWASISGLATFIASGSSHAAGIVPDPGSTAGLFKVINEDTNWAEEFPGRNSWASFGCQFVSAAGTNTSVGSTITVTGNGTGTTVGTGATGEWQNYTTTTTNQAIGWSSSSVVAKQSWKPRLVARWMVGSTSNDTASIRFWAALSNTGLIAQTSDVPNISLFGFRYSTNASDPAIMLISCDASGLGNCGTTSTGMAWTQSHVYVGEAWNDSSTTVSGHIMDVTAGTATAVVTTSTHVDTSVTSLVLSFGAMNLNGGGVNARQINVAKFCAASN